ncbi:MAG: ATP-dependent Clp protease proteolytic subunit, partial [Ruthenibacterium sp.]
IVPTATMTIHPVRHSGLVLGVPQTMRYFEQMQQRITSFVTGHSQISAARFTQLMMHTGELVMDVGSVLDGKSAVREGLIDSIGSIGDALAYLYDAIEGRTEKPAKRTKAAKLNLSERAEKPVKPEKPTKRAAVRTGETPVKRDSAKGAKAHA